MPNHTKLIGSLEVSRRHHWLRAMQPPHLARARFAAEPSNHPSSAPPIAPVASNRDLGPRGNPRTGRRRCRRRGPFGSRPHALRPVHRGSRQTGRRRRPHEPPAASKHTARRLSASAARASRHAKHGSPVSRFDTSRGSALPPSASADTGYAARRPSPMATWLRGYRTQPRRTGVDGGDGHDVRGRRIHADGCAEGGPRSEVTCAPDAVRYAAFWS